MPWNESARIKYCPAPKRRANELSDEQWTTLEPLLSERVQVGRPPKWDLRSIVEGLFHMLVTGCQWRMIPVDYPPWQTLQYHFYKWRDDGRWWTINHHFVMENREKDGREASPSAGAADSQTVKMQAVAGPRGYDAGKKDVGRKRHTITDTSGNILAVHVTPADVQDRDGLLPVATKIRSLYPWLRHLFVDGAYRGPETATTMLLNGGFELEIASRPPGEKGFIPVKVRWVIERTFGWLTRHRRLARDFESLVKSSEAWIAMASVRLMLRRVVN